MDLLDKKERGVSEKERGIIDKEKRLFAKRKDLENLIEEEKRVLQRVAGLSKDEAKKILLKRIESDVRDESAVIIKKVEEETKLKADKEARKIIGLAIQRCAADHTVETTVSVVHLPNDEMKGRIIGREGRNIRALEIATGVDVIVDDTPEAVILSGFDVVKRVIARIALERLISDGRIHPGRIEEVVEKVKKEMAETIREEGEQAALDVGQLISQLPVLGHGREQSLQAIRHLYAIGADD